MSFASTTITCVSSDGRRFETTIEVGPPYVIDDREAACPIRMPGIEDKVRGVHGGSTMQALCLALRMARFYLDEFVKYGGQLYMSPEDDLASPPGLIISVGSMMRLEDEYPEYVAESRRRAMRTQINEEDDPG